MPPAEAQLRQAPSGITEAEWSQRVNLAACYRLVAHYGWDDLVDTHISARVPGPDHHFLINPYGTAVASSLEGLLPLNQTAQLVTHDLAYHDYEGVALDHDERPRLQKDLGSKNHMLLRNHGTLTVGRSVASAFERMYHLERACTMQVRTRMLGPAAYPVEQSVIDKNEAVFSNPDSAELRSTTLVWPPLLRKLDRIDPGYRD